MNRKWSGFGSLLLGAAAIVLAVSPAWAAPEKSAKVVRNRFFIVSEVNLQKHQLILELPTQITRVMSVDSKTTFTDEAGRHQPLNKIRAGDTVFVTYQQTPKGLLALSLRDGPMTVSLLHKLYVKG